MSIQQSVAVNVRKWRLRRIVSVSALARAAGVSKSTITEIDGERGNPSLKTLRAMTAPEIHWLPLQRRRLRRRRTHPPRR